MADNRICHIKHILPQRFLKKKLLCDAKYKILHIFAP